MTNKKSLSQPESYKTFTWNFFAIFCRERPGASIYFQFINIITKEVKSMPHCRKKNPAGGWPAGRGKYYLLIIRVSPFYEKIMGESSKFSTLWHLQAKIGINTHKKERPQKCWRTCKIPDEIWKGKTSLCSSIATRNPPCGFRIKHPAGIALLRLINGRAGETLSRCPGHLSTPHQPENSCYWTRNCHFRLTHFRAFPFLPFFWNFHKSGHTFLENCLAIIPLIQQYSGNLLFLLRGKFFAFQV